MKLVLTIQLQQNDGTPVFTGTQTKSAFSPDSGSINDDFKLVKGFLVGESVSNLVKLMCWIAAGQVALTGTPTLTISQL